MVKLSVAVEAAEIPIQARKARWYQLLWDATHRLGYDVPKSISIALIDDDVMRRINKQTRGINRVTDVLSFLYGINEGELLLAPHQAARQYKAFKSRSIKDELKRLVIHGYLHLAGLDHKKEKERHYMEKAMKTILSRVKAV